MSDNQRLRQLHVADMPILINMQIGSADAGRPNIHQYGVGIQFRRGDVVNPQVARSMESSSFHRVVSLILSCGIGGVGNDAPVPLDTGFIKFQYARNVRRFGHKVHRQVFYVGHGIGNSAGVTHQF